MQIVINIDDDVYKRALVYKGVQLASNSANDLSELITAIANGTPLPKYMKELKRRLLMEVDGSTDDRYLRYADICDRISGTIDTYVQAESEGRDEKDIAEIERLWQKGDYDSLVSALIFAPTVIKADEEKTEEVEND